MTASGQPSRPLVFGALLFFAFLGLSCGDGSTDPPTPPTITTTSLSDGVVGMAESQVIAATGGTKPYTWSISSGTLPTGLDITASTGAISGTPTLAGTSTFTAMVTGADGLSDTQILSIAIGGLGIGFGSKQFSRIPAGSFQMGSSNGEHDERPIHTVNLTQPFYMQKTEVTQAQWVAVMGSNPSSDPDCGDTCPVDNVSWNDAETFLATLNAMDPGKNYRLPTEAEWEYACRAGTTGDYGGTGVLDEMGWYISNSDSTTHPAAQKQANAWGLFDMHGNVWEWVQDWYSPSYYYETPATDPQGPAGPLTSRVLRGGSWIDDARWRTRAAYRDFNTPTVRLGTYGFRLARTP